MCDIKKWTFEIGQRVGRYEDPHDMSKGIKWGLIMERYSRPQEVIGSTTLGPYPELYMVQFDDGTIGKAYLPHGLIDESEAEYN